MRPLRAVLLAAVLAGLPCGAQALETGFLDRSLHLDGAEHAYQVYVPRTFDPSRAWPVILALHGSGERGRDGILQTEIGLGGALRRYAERYPAVVVLPQAPPDGTWQGPGARLALAALDATLAEFPVDSTRVYLTGLSMGGNGAWYLAYHHPERFAALVVVCGWINERRGGLYPAIPPGSASDPFADVARRVAHLPIWIFHGDADDVVPVAESRGMAAALEAIGADVRYTEFPGVGHGAWGPAYGLEELPVWLFQQRRR
jgi:predicted peptidase